VWQSGGSVFAPTHARKEGLDVEGVWVVAQMPRIRRREAAKKKKVIKAVVNYQSWQADKPARVGRRVDGGREEFARSTGGGREGKKGERALRLEITSKERASGGALKR